jgi:hypothetical protein
MLESVAAF